MALGTDHTTGSGKASGTEDTFIPELWSDEVNATYKNSLVLSNLVKKISFVGKKGDSIHIPKPVRESASAKAASTQVTLVASAASELVVTVNKHFEYSRLIEDITEVQALASMRAFYTDDAGYALAVQVDSDLAALAAGFQASTAYSTAVTGATGATVWDGSASTNTGNGSSFTDIGLRRVIQTLDDSNVPLDGRSLIIPPSEKNALLGIDRFNSSDFVNVKGVATGMFGDIYGTQVYVTTNLDTVAADDTTTLYKAAMLMHRDATVLAEQMSVRTQTQYKQEWLGDLFTADTIYGVSEYRDEAGVAIIVPA
jgi:hypothetical protein